MYYFIVNPNSRCGHGYYVWTKIEQRLMEASVEFEAYLTKAPGQARTFAEQLTRGLKRSIVIVIVGGDGTLNEVIDGIAFNEYVTLGHIPAGSGNDLARSMKYPHSVKRCLKKVLNPKYHKLLDYGVITYGEETVHHRRFAISAGMGLDAAVCQRMLYSRSRKVLNRIGLEKLSYSLLGGLQLLRTKPVKGYVILDREKRVEFNHVYLISAHIHPYEGNGFCFAPKADCSDGKLEICVLNQSSKLKVVPVLFRALINRKTKGGGFRTFTCKEAVIHLDRPMAVHVDGEDCQYQKEIEVQCIEKKIRMIL